MALNHRQATMLREREDVLHKNAELTALLALKDKEIDRLNGEVTRLSILVEQAKVSGWSPVAISGNPQDVMREIRERTTKRIKVGALKTGRKPKQPVEEIEYDTTWQVKDGDNTPSVTEGTINPV